MAHSAGNTLQSQSQSLVCGGDGPRFERSCYVWGSEGWERGGVRLREARHQHVSWPRSEGLLLLGGQFPAGSSTELVSWDGTRTEESFTMKYWETSLACGVADTETETIIITGGWLTKTTVSSYSTRGWEEDLPSLTTGRYSHGCAQYFSSDGSKVTQYNSAREDSP